MKVKRCSKCGLTKPVDQFHKSTARGHQSHCKPCKVSEKREWIKVNRDKERVNKLWSKYRLRPEQYELILNAQDGKCALCKGEFGRSGPVIDHDHKCCEGTRSCGKCVRGILCAKCNAALGGYEYLVSLGDLVHSYLDQE